MAQRHPGLDEVMSDDTLDAFTGGHPPVLEEPPPRMWPTVLLSASAASVVSVVIGILIADFVTVLHVLFVVTCIITAVAAVVWIELRDAERSRQ